MRARFLVVSLFLFGAVYLHAQGGTSYDLIIRNARIVDGTASPWSRGEIAVRGDTIAQIAPRIDGKAAREAAPVGENRSALAGGGRVAGFQHVQDFRADARRTDRVQQNLDRFPLAGAAVVS